MRKRKPELTDETPIAEDHVEARNDRTTGDLFAVDPSVSSAGVALFRGGVLIAASRIRLEPGKRDHGAKCMRMAHQILAWVVGQHAEPRTLVMEWPKIYHGAKGKVDPNDLIGLAGIDMAVAGALTVALIPRNITLELVTPLPSDWIGQLPKTKTVKGAKVSPRGAFILGKLTDEEALIVPASHDAIDAIGIGLWGLQRLERHRVFAGAVA